MLDLVLLALLAALTGAVAGLLATYWFLTRHVPADTVAPVEPADPFVSAEIDQAAARWAATKGRPEAAGIMADKLHMLYDLARRRRRP